VNLALTVLEITAPVFLLAATGFAWVKLGFEYRMEFVTRFAMKLAVPCLIFTALMKTEIAPAALTALSLAAFLAYAALALVAFLALKLLKLDQRTYLNPLIFGNTGNLGLPLALFAFGETGLSYAVVVFAVMAIGSFTFGVYVVAGGGNPIKAVKEPLVGATALGALFLAQGWQTPAFLTNALDLIGQMAIPMMLITLGVAVARLKPQHLGRAAALSLVKLVLSVAIGYGTGRALGLEDVALAVLTMQIATPVAVTSYMLAAAYGADDDAVAGLVVASTLISVAAFPLLLAVLL